MLGERKLYGRLSRVVDNSEYNFKISGNGVCEYSFKISGNGGLEVAWLLKGNVVCLLWKHPASYTVLQIPEPVGFLEIIYFQL